MKNIIKVFIIASAIIFSGSRTYSQVNVSAAVSIQVAPPLLLTYSQPPCQVDGYLWSPGYWAYGSEGYYWVAGAWVMPPTVGYLWTPGYWGFAGGYYGWNAGYWGSQIGFYGGVNYGFGYGGVGFSGGMWQNGHFRYNTAVVNVNTTIVHNTYINNTHITNTSSRVSFNGPGGIAARPSAQERLAMNQPHVQPTAEQSLHEHTASLDRTQLASVNHAAMAPRNPAGRTGTSNHVSHVQTSNAPKTPSTSVHSSANIRTPPSPRPSGTTRAPTNTQAPRAANNGNIRTPHAAANPARSTHGTQQAHPVHPAGGARQPGGDRH